MHIYYYEFFKDYSFHISPLLGNYEIWRIKTKTASMQMCSCDKNTLFFYPNISFSIFFQRSNQLTHVIFQYILHTEKLAYLALNSGIFSQASRFLNPSLKNNFQETVHSHKLC